MPAPVVGVGVDHAGGVVASRKLFGGCDVAFEVRYVIAVFYLGFGDSEHTEECAVLVVDGNAYLPVKRYGVYIGDAVGDGEGCVVFHHRRADVHGLVQVQVVECGGGVVDRMHEQGALVQVVSAVATTDAL